MLRRLSRRHLALDSRGRLAFGRTQIVRRLQIQPELGCVAEVPRQPQCGAVTPRLPLIQKGPVMMVVEGLPLLVIAAVPW